MKPPRRYIHRMTLEIDADLYDQVEDKAAAGGHRSVAAYVREAIAEKVKKES